MDSLSQSERHTLFEAMDAARQHGLKVEVVPITDATSVEGRRQPSTRIRVQRDGHHADYDTEVKASLPASAWPSMLHQLERLHRRVMLVADHIPPALAEEMRSKHIAFLDMAGNVFVEQSNFLISVEGRKRVGPLRKAAVGRAFQPTGLQVIFTLLCMPEAVNQPYRTLAAMSGVAHGTVGWVIPELQQMGFIQDLSGKRGTRRLFDRRRLCDLWVNAYITMLRPRLLLARFYARSIDGWENWYLARHGSQWGGEPAAALLTKYLKPGEMTLYAETIPSALIAKQTFLKDAGPGQQMVVDIRKLFWNFPQGQDAPLTVPPLLIYADLLAIGDERCRETADMIYENHLVRLLTQT